MIVPLLSSLLKKKETFQRVVKFNLILNLSISFVISIPLIIFSSFIMSLFGEEFTSHNSVIVLMCIASILITYNSVVGKIIASSGNMWFGFLFNSIWGVILLSLTYILVRVCNAGSEGYAMAFLLSYFIHSVIQTLYLKNFRKKNENRNSDNMV
jgi:Na+-driven multidrug efflux pump